MKTKLLEIKKTTPAQIISVCDHTFLNRPEAYRRDAILGESPVRMRERDFFRFLEQMCKSDFTPYAVCVRPEDAKPLEERFQKAVNKVSGPKHYVKKYILKDGKVVTTLNDVSRREYDRELNEGETAIGRVEIKRYLINPSMGLIRAVGDVIFNLSARPKITRVDRVDGDYLVLGCDGLWDVATTDEVGAAVREMITQGLTESEIAEQLTKAALEHESKDNVSVMVVKL